MTLWLHEATHDAQSAKELFALLSQERVDSGQSQNVLPVALPQAPPLALPFRILFIFLFIHDPHDCAALRSPKAMHAVTCLELQGLPMLCLTPVLVRHQTRNDGVVAVLACAKPTETQIKTKYLNVRNTS